MVRKMAGKLALLLREYVFPLSILLTIAGIIVLFLGIAGTWFQDLLKDIFGFSGDVLQWSPYLLVLGFIVFIAGVWYLYTYVKNRKYVLGELETNKRSEFLKSHIKLKALVKHMPSKYKTMLQEKEKELNVK